MRGRVTRAAKFPQADAGLSAVEFALILPILLTITLGGGQLVQYINALRKIEAVAGTIGSMVSQATPPSAATTLATVNSLDLNFSYDSAMITFPYLLYDAKVRGSNWRSNITISYASVAFNKLSDACANFSDQSACYVASVVWTSTGTSGNSYRPCGIPQLPVDDSAPYSRYTLPRSVFGSGSVIVVDVTFRYIPAFGSGFIPPVTITRSAYFQPRYASQINYDSTASDGIASTCL